MKPGSHSAEAGQTLGQARRFLTRAGLQTDDDAGTWTPLTGGVSSNLWRVDLPDRTLCVKGAVGRLRVADDWQAPLDRNGVEYAWLTFARAHHPDNVPRVFAHDPAAALFAMEFLPPAEHPVWKSQLLAGTVDQGLAGKVGALVGSLHAASTRNPAVPTDFATDANFAALRLNPYFRVTARRNPDVAVRLEELALRTARTRVALVHGDVSPKNVLSGPSGPVLLDAECAWFGEPAFDVAFCLTHLCLKMLLALPDVDALVGSARGLLAGYSAQVGWEDPAALDHRIATLLPALLLARVDGASPVEYLTDPNVKGLVRRVAVELLREPADRPMDVVEAWRDGCGARRRR